jgi:hypothetical protein
MKGTSTKIIEYNLEHIKELSEMGDEKKHL